MVNPAYSAVKKIDTSDTWVALNFWWAIEKKIDNVQNKLN